jgi:hypothetical protein
MLFNLILHLFCLSFESGSGKWYLEIIIGVFIGILVIVSGQFQEKELLNKTVYTKNSHC